MRHRVCLAAAAVLALLTLSAAPAVAERKLRAGLPAVPHAQLIPTKGVMHGHEVYFQIPPDPAGTVFFAHGCAHSASDFWPPSAVCPECRGLPMEIAHSKQALARGYAVISINSADRQSKCYSYQTDASAIAAILEQFKAENFPLAFRPIYAVGVSSGGGISLKLPKLTHIDGVVAEAMGVDPGDWGAEEVKPFYPPAIWMRMPKDLKTSVKIDADQAVMQSLGRPHAVITLLERPIYPEYFSDMSPFIDPYKSALAYHGLKFIGMVGADGHITQDPRYTKLPWQHMLQAVVPTLSSSDVASDTSQIYELMNVAFAWHESNGEYLTACLAFLELGGMVNMDALVSMYKITGRLADLTADRYPLGGKPIQAAASAVTAFSTLSRDQVFTSAPGITAQTTLVPSADFNANYTVAVFAEDESQLPLGQQAAGANASSSSSAAGEAQQVALQRERAEQLASGPLAPAAAPAPGNGSATAAVSAAWAGGGSASASSSAVLSLVMGFAAAAVLLMM